MWNESEIEELVDGPGRELIEGGCLSIKRIKTVLEGTNIVGKCSITQRRTRINFERKKLEDENEIRKKDYKKGLALKQ